MAGFEVKTNQYLLRDTLWSAQLKTIVDDELSAMKYVRILDVPADAGSSTFKIPSIGDATTRAFTEGGRITYDKFDEGEYNFTFDQYRYSANSVSEKFKRDSFWSSDVVARFLPRQRRALMVDIERRIFEVANKGQTASNTNTINTGEHRWIGAGANETIALQDFAKAQFSLKKANMPMSNLVAVVDPSVVYTLQTQANVVNLMSPTYSSIISDVNATGMKFAGMNVYGFDVYSSNYLPACGTSHNGTGIETIGGLSTGAGICNYLFHASTDDLSTWVGGFRQHPTVFTEFNKDTQETETFTITEWGFQGDFRPENLVTILTDTDQVFA
jgi:hypothetical protein